MDQIWKVSKKTTSGAFFRTICEVWCFCSCFLEFSGCFGYSLGLGAIAHKFVHFCLSSCIFWLWGYFLAVLAFLCLFARKNKNERRANIEQRRATSSNVEQTSSKTSSNVEQTSSNVEQRRATSSKRRATSSNVEQRREVPKKPKKNQMPESAHRCANVHNFASKCLQTQ